MEFGDARVGAEKEKYGILGKTVKIIKTPLARHMYYQSRIKCPLFGGKKLKWSDDNKHPTRPHNILKN